MAASSRSATNPWYAAGRRSHGGHQRAPDTRYDASKRKQPAAVEGESRRAAATRSAPVTMAHALVRRTKATAAIAGQMRTAPTKARLVALLVAAARRLSLSHGRWLLALAGVVSGVWAR